MTDTQQTQRSSTGFPMANRAYHPTGYDLWWAQGRQAAEEGKPRQCPLSVFGYGYDVSCWLDGYDNVRQEEIA